MIRLVQLSHSAHGRRVALVQEPDLFLLSECASVYELANRTITTRRPLKDFVMELATDESLAYDPIYNGDSQWKLLPCFDHPTDPHHCMLSGTGLTHKASADNRQKMHDAAHSDAVTDSMKMYQMGVEGGRPDKGKIGIQPEWFYKGNGSMLFGHNHPLEVPAYAEDGGEEPEIAGIYISDQFGNPHRVGFTAANEFSDHIMERRNYLYLAPSKLRPCAIGPELVVGGTFKDLSGTVRIIRGGKVIWNKKIKTGNRNIVHSLVNLEYHHFKYKNHRQPEMAHIHFMGADAFSFGENIILKDGDVMGVHWDGFGRELKNPLQSLHQAAGHFEVPTL